MPTTDEVTSVMPREMEIRQEIRKLVAEAIALGDVAELALLGSCLWAAEQNVLAAQNAIDDSDS
jgi:hypothetical protein